MSKFIPDPQIQSLRAMRAGDIAIALPTPVIAAVGKQSVAFVQPIVRQSESLAAVPSLEAVSGPFGESPVIGDVFATTLSTDTLQSKSLGTTNAIEAVSGPFNESPVVGVGTGTSVI